jgi:hypothetical protein
MAWSSSNERSKTMGWQLANDLTINWHAPLAFGDPAGYQYAQFKQIIIYRGWTQGQGYDGRIHQLQWENNAWHHNDLTATAGAPLASLDSEVRTYVAYLTGGTQHVVYLGQDSQGVPDRHVHEIYADDTNDWQHTDLTVAAGAPLAVTTPTGHEFRRRKHVFYEGFTTQANGYIYELWQDDEGWHYNTLTGPLTPLVAMGPLNARVFSPIGTQHVIYRAGVNGPDIQELQWDTTGWHQHDLTFAAAAPSANGDLTNYTFEDQDTQHINYLGVDGHIHELWWNYDNGWHHNDLTNATGRAPAPAANGRPTGYIYRQDKTQHVNYRGADGHIYELKWDNGWQPYKDLTIETDGPLAGGDPTGYEFTPNFGQGSQHVIYTTRDHHLIELRWVP